MPKNVCFAAFQYFLSKFCVNINGDLKLRGGCVCGEKLYKVSMRAVFCVEGFGTVSD